MTPNEILLQQLSGMSVRISPVLIPHVHQAMQEYADQEKSAERERIKQVIDDAFDPGQANTIKELIDSL